jgi:hypothetical protein
MAKWLSHNELLRKGTSPVQMIESESVKQKKEKRDWLYNIVEILILCLQQNFALRGHEEDRSNLNEMSDVNRGNFLEILSFLARHNPAMMEKVKRHGVMWLSPSIQNELIDLIAQRVFVRISEKVTSGGEFGLIVDEASDLAKREQVSISLRFVTEDGQIEERFFGFYKTDVTTAKALTEIILTVLQENGFDVKNLVGMSFDGASNMSGEKIEARLVEISMQPSK